MKQIESTERTQEDAMRLSIDEQAAEAAAAAPEMDDEELFIRELRALAGMDEAAPKPAPVSAAKPAPAVAPQQRTAAKQTAAAEQEQETAEQSARGSGWRKGVWILLASTLILLLTMAAVIYGLHTPIS